MNDYVYGNYKSRIEDNFLARDEVYYQNVRAKFIQTVEDITSVILCLLALICPEYLTTDDYTDYMEADQQPPEGCQY